MVDRIKGRMNAPTAKPLAELVNSWSDQQAATECIVESAMVDIYIPLQSSVTPW